MNISTIIRNTKQTNALHGFASVTIHSQELGDITLHGIKIWKNEDGLAIQLPFEKNGIYKNYSYNISNNLLKEISRIVLENFQNSQIKLETA